MSAQSDRELVTGDSTACRGPEGRLGADILTYLAHTEGKLPFRQIARARGCPASTVLRQVRRIEAQRDDLLFDEALQRVAAALSENSLPEGRSEEWVKMVGQAAKSRNEAESTIDREARRILRRLCEKDAFLAVATDMEKAIVMRESVPGRHTRTAVVDRDVAHQFALRDWISCLGAGRIARYGITDAGRSALKRLLEEERLARQPRGGFAEVSTPFRAQHQEPAERRVMAPDGSGEQKLRYNLAESPLTILGRKPGPDGEPYLRPEMVDAGERLREDFELAQMGPRTTQNWDSFLTPRDRGGISPGRGPADGPQAARDRVAAAMAALGPGLSDVALRVCCFLDGLETAEKRLGWSARSGKVVLRIALERLVQHYGLGPRKVYDPTKE